jgi:hypothetical protein
MIQEINERLLRAFPATTDKMVYRTAKSGILLADDLVKNVRFLNNLIGRDLKGHIRRAGIMYQFHKACQEGDLPFKTDMNKMPNGHWSHIEIKSASENFSAHICRTDEAGGFPEDTLTRQDARLVNQPDLFLPRENVIPILPMLYAWLTWGADGKGDITHLAWGAPEADMQNWLGYRNVIEAIEEDESSPEIPPDVPDPKSRLRFLEHIEVELAPKKDDKKPG